MYCVQYSSHKTLHNIVSLNQHKQIKFKTRLHHDIAIIAMNHIYIYMHVEFDKK